MALEKASLLLNVILLSLTLCCGAPQDLPIKESDIKQIPEANAANASDDAAIAIDAQYVIDLVLEVFCDSNRTQDSKDLETDRYYVKQVRASSALNSG